MRPGGHMIEAVRAVADVQDCAVENQSSVIPRPGERFHRIVRRSASHTGAGAEAARWTITALHRSDETLNSATAAVISSLQ